MARRRVNTTKLEIVQKATRMFLQQGYSATSMKAIADSLNMSTGHLTFYFPTKERLLAEMADMLCAFRCTQIRRCLDDGESPLTAVCLRLAVMTAICEVNEIAKDFYIAAYTHPTTLEIIRRNDAERAQMVFEEYCRDWTRQQHAEAETLVSGIEYATLMTTGDSAPVDVRIAGALNNILRIFGMPEALRKERISQVLAMDYVAIGQQMLECFVAFIEDANEQAIEELLCRK